MEIKFYLILFKIYEQGNLYYLFKDLLPFMSQHYGFEYELVQYKWPRWLNQQSEKQRIIWG